MLSLEQEAQERRCSALEAELDVPIRVARGVEAEPVGARPGWHAERELVNAGAREHLEERGVFARELDPRARAVVGYDLGTTERDAVDRDDELRGVVVGPSFTPTRPSG